MVRGAFLDLGISSNVAGLRFYDFTGMTGSRPGVSENNYPTQMWRYFDSRSQDLLTEQVFTDPYMYAGDLSYGRKMQGSGTYDVTNSVKTVNTYNFMGKPLKKTVTEGTYASPTSVTTTRTTVLGYAYWGKEKYFQQMATQDNAGRYTYTDYYDWNATAGKKGQTYRVYDPKNAGFYLDTSVTPPSGTPIWRGGLQHKRSGPS